MKRFQRPLPRLAGAALMAGCLCLVPRALAINDQPANVAPNPSFELEATRLGGWLPLGVESTNGPARVFITNSMHFHGQRALCVRPGPQGLVAGRSWVAGYNGGEEDTRATGTNGIRGARTIALRLDPDIRSVSGSVWIHGPATARFTLSLVWTGRRDRRPAEVLGVDKTNQASGEQYGWRRYELVTTRPIRSHQVQLWIRSCVTPRPAS